MHTFHYTLPYTTQSFINPCCYIINHCSSCNRDQDYVPIQIDIRPYMLPHTWDDPNELPSMSGDRYFLKVFPPYTNNSIGTPRDTPYNHIKIDKYGIYTNTTLIGLLPSPSNSIKGCYRVEYWRWNKLLINGDTNLGCKVECGLIKPITDVEPSSQLLKSEWWYIGPRFSRCGRDMISIPMIRKDDDNLLIPNNTDYIDNKSSREILMLEEISGINKEYQDDWEFVMEQGKGPFHPQIKERVVNRLGIKWRVGPRPGTPYTIKYKRPYTLQDIIYRPTKREQELLNINTY